MGSVLTVFVLGSCCGPAGSTVPLANRAQLATLNAVSESLAVEMRAQAHRQRQMNDSATTLMDEVRRQLSLAASATPYEDDPKYDDLRALAIEAARDQQKAEQAAARHHCLSELVDQLRVLSNRTLRQTHPLSTADCSHLLHQLRLLTGDEVLCSLACVAGHSLYSGGLTDASINSFDARLLRRNESGDDGHGELNAPLRWPPVTAAQVQAIFSACQPDAQKA